MEPTIKQINIFKLTIFPLTFNIQKSISSRGHSKNKNVTYNKTRKQEGLSHRLALDTTQVTPRKSAYKTHSYQFGSDAIIHKYMYSIKKNHLLNFFFRYYISIFPLLIYLYTNQFHFIIGYYTSDYIHFSLHTYTYIPSFY